MRTSLEISFLPTCPSCLCPLPSNAAPFYVLDEVDAALDAPARRSLVRYLSRPGGSQLLATTFRKEFLGKADKIFGVRFLPTRESEAAGKEGRRAMASQA